MSKVRLYLIRGAFFSSSNVQLEVYVILVVH